MCLAIPGKVISIEESPDQIFRIGIDQLCFRRNGKMNPALLFNLADGYESEKQNQHHINQPDQKPAGSFFHSCPIPSNTTGCLI